MSLHTYSHLKRAWTLPLHRIYDSYMCHNVSETYAIWNRSKMYADDYMYVMISVSDMFQICVVTHILKHMPSETDLKCMSSETCSHLKSTNPPLTLHTYVTYDSYMHHDASETNAIWNICDPKDIVIWNIWAPPLTLHIWMRQITHINVSCLRASHISVVMVRSMTT